MNDRKRILFICGSMNQTTQMHQIAQHLPEHEHAFTPFYCDGPLSALRRTGMLEFTIMGSRHTERCRAYLHENGLPIDEQGRRQPYDLVVTCTDVYVPRNVRDRRIVLVQEGITDPEQLPFRLVRRCRFLPRWLAGTAATGLSHAYEKFCVASEGYRELFARKGADPARMQVTGIPNFDNCERYCANDFPHRNYVLACTSPLREVFRREDRPAFIRRAVEIARGRPLIFKLHPNERVERATREIKQHAGGPPEVMVFAEGSAEAMIANCDVLLTRFSSTAFVGLALGKETHSDVDIDELRRLLPVQNRSAARNIADVCRTLLEEDRPQDTRQVRKPANTGVRVVDVQSRRDRRRFQQVPWAIYAGAMDGKRRRRDPNWVPPLLHQERQLLGWRRHPFHDNAESATFLAERQGRPVGRLCVLINHLHNRHHNENRGFFGFFDCIDDAAVAASLFDAGEQWLRRRGMTALRGPVNPSLNHSCGLLVDGFTSAPRLLMTYNPPYYERLLTACGFEPSHDLYAYEVETPFVEALCKRYKRASRSVLARSDVVIRPLDRTRFEQDVTTYLDIYNAALADTWGFTPLQSHEAKHIARELRHIVVPDLVQFAEIRGKPVGAVLALPDYNQALRRLNGRLFPVGLFRLMIGSRRIDAVRTLAITMSPQYQNSGLAVALMTSLIESARTRGIKHWEFSWILESNARSRRPLEKCGIPIGKTYRLFDKSL